MPFNHEITDADPCLGNVLVVDDERTNREILARMLVRSGYQSTAVSSGREAISRLESESFDLVLLDVVMPDMNGFECLQIIRLQNRISELPVIMVTAETDRETIVAAFKAGANDYVTKPIDREITLARIRTHIQLRRSLAALRNSEERYALAASGSNDGLWDWDVTGHKVYYSPRWKSMLGCTEDQIGNLPDEWWQRIHPDDLEKFHSSTNTCVAIQQRNISCEVRMLHGDGTYRWMLCRGVFVANDAGRVYRMAGSLTDITEGKVGDPLTGLPNRLLFVDLLERALERLRRSPQAIFAVLFLDIDKFKLINDSLGHQAGDQLLLTIARRLGNCLRSTDPVALSIVPNPGAFTVARHAGDEFTVLLEGLTSINDVELIAQRILTAVSRPVQVADQETVPTVSIGWTIGNSPSQSTEDLLREADTAMYEAKSAGRNRASRFEAQMQQRATRRLEIEKDLRRALKEQQFYLNYQPIVDLKNRETIGFEALVRWQHPEKGCVSPAEFIPTADETGLIVPLGWIVTEQAFRQSAMWSNRFPKATPHITINCAVKQLYQPDFLARFRELIQQTGVRGEHVCLEVTEGTLMDRPEILRPILEELQEIGVRIAIDDFGTGYSSLSYLHRFPLDLLKIDRSFVQNMMTSDEHFEIVRTIVGLGRSLKLKMVAEGVETLEQYDRLLELGCDFAQGYLFSPPISASQTETLLIRQAATADPAVRFPQLDAMSSLTTSGTNFISN